MYAKKTAESPDTANAPPVIDAHRKERSAAPVGRHPSPPPPHNHKLSIEDVAGVYAGRPFFYSLFSQRRHHLQRLCRGMLVSHRVDSAVRSSPGQQLCNRGYGNITYVGAHNSYAVGINNRKLCTATLLFFNCPTTPDTAAANQERNSERSYYLLGYFTLISVQVTLQLNDGVRLLQMQAHENSGDIYLCHTDCVGTHIIHDAAPPEQALGITQRRNSARLPQDRYETACASGELLI